MSSSCESDRRSAADSVVGPFAFRHPDVTCESAASHFDIRTRTRLPMTSTVWRSTTACMVLALTFGAAAGTRPNFTGVWVMDRSRSISIPPDLQQTLTVTHNGDQVKVDIKVKAAQGERSFTDVYTLDNKESEFTPQGLAGPAPGKGKRKAYWLPNDKGIVVAEETTTDSPNGAVTNQQSRKWTLSSDGTTLTVDYYFDGPRGSFEA